MFYFLFYEIELTSGLKNDLLRFCISKNQWVVLKQSGSVPPPMCSHFMFILGNDLVVFEANTFTHLYQLDLSKNKWKKVKISFPSRFNNQLSPSESKYFTMTHDPINKSFYLVGSESSIFLTCKNFFFLIFIIFFEYYFLFFIFYFFYFLFFIIYLFLK